MFLLYFSLLLLVTAQIAYGQTSVFVVSLSCNQWHNCTEEVNQAVGKCKTLINSTCTVKLLAGTYAMNTVADAGSVIGIYGAASLYLIGEGSQQTTLMFDNLATFFTVGQTKGVAFVGFAVDMSRVPFTLGKVISSAAHKSILSVPDQTLYPTDESTVRSYSFMTRSQALLGYDPSTERFTTPDIYSLLAPFNVSYSEDGSQMTVTGAPRLTVGEWIVVRHQVYDYNVFSVSLSSSVVFDDVVLFAAGGMGVVTQRCTDITFSSFATRRKRFPNGKVRAMSITADGIHMCNTVGGEVRVSGCVLEGQGDDGLNINTGFGRISSISKDRKTVLLTGYQNAPANGLLWPGIEAEVFSGATMALKVMTPTVASVAATGVTFTTALQQEVQLYDLMINNEANAASVVIENSQFLNNRARGVLLKQPNAAVIGCHFSGQTSPAILSQIDGCFWMEGRPIWSWAVINNTIEAPDGFGPATIISLSGEVPQFVDGKPDPSQCVSVTLPGVFANVTISSNTIISRPGNLEESISVWATARVAITNNTIRNDLPSPPPPRPDIQTFYCSGIVEEDTNVCETMNGTQRQCCIVNSAP